MGRTDLEVSQLGLGGLFTSRHGGERKTSIRAIHAALDAGINYIDTAPGYFDSEEVIGAALSARTDRDELIISTKLGGRPTPFDPHDVGALKQSVETSLRNLGREVIDVLLIHEPDRPGQYAWWTNLPNADGPVMDAIDQLKEEEKIRFAGLGGTTAYAMTRLVETGKFDVLLTAANYSLLWREATIELLPAANAIDMATVVGTPLQQGALAARYDDQIAQGAWWMAPPRREQFRRLYELLDELDMPITELAHRFLLSDPKISCVLSGARSDSEILSNVAASEADPLGADLIHRLNEIAELVPFRPYDEPTILPFGRTWDGPFELR
ncbi:MAG: aldo/keto reductase [Actinomycetota bacterium]|nr:aldo/keto reductase [Actinomycetota bacterium]